MRVVLRNLYCQIFPDPHLETLLQSEFLANTSRVLPRKLIFVKLCELCSSEVSTILPLNGKVLAQFSGVAVCPGVLSHSLPQVKAQLESPRGVSNWWGSLVGSEYPDPL